MPGPRRRVGLVIRRLAVVVRVRDLADMSIFRKLRVKSLVERIGVV